MILCKNKLKTTEDMDMYGCTTILKKVLAI